LAVPANCNGGSDGNALEAETTEADIERFAGRGGFGAPGGFGRVNRPQKTRLCWKSFPHATCFSRGCPKP